MKKLKMNQIAKVWFTGYPKLRLQIYDKSRKSNTKDIKEMYARISGSGIQILWLLKVFWKQLFFKSE